MKYYVVTNDQYVLWNIRLKIKRNSLIFWAFESHLPQRQTKGHALSTPYMGLGLVSYWVYPVMCCSLFHSCLGSPWVTVAHDLLHCVCRCTEGRGSLLWTGFVLAFLLERYRLFLYIVFVPVIQTASTQSNYNVGMGSKWLLKAPSHFVSLWSSQSSREWRPHMPKETDFG